MNTENEKEEEYIPPGKRLITPADVVELDPSMTVIIQNPVFIYQELFHVGTQGCKVTRIDGIDHLTNLTVESAWIVFSIEPRAPF